MTQLARRGLWEPLVLSPSRVWGRSAVRSISVTSSTSFGVFDRLPARDNHASHGVYRIAWTHEEGRATTSGRWAVFAPADVATSARKEKVHKGLINEDRGSLLGTFADLMDALNVSSKFRELGVKDQQTAMKHLYNSKSDDLLRLSVWRAALGIDSPEPLEFQRDDLTHEEREALYLDQEPAREVQSKHRRSVKKRTHVSSVRTPEKSNTNSQNLAQTQQQKAGDDERTEGYGGWFG